ncbi:unnamed protein product, partial [marine sediment metagenome]
YLSHPIYHGWEYKVGELIPTDGLILYYDPGVQMITGATANEEYPALLL